MQEGMKVQVEPTALELLGASSSSNRWVVLNVNKEYDIIIISPEANLDVTCCASGAMLKPL